MEQAYKDYLQSGVWGMYRAVVLERAGDVCEVCGVDGTLHIHHQTYIRVGGNEKFEDLIALCPQCHKRVHELSKQRAKWTRFRHGLSVALILLRREVEDGQQDS